MNFGGRLRLPELVAPTYELSHLEGRKSVPIVSESIVMKARGEPDMCRTLPKRQSPSRLSVSGTSLDESSRK